MGGLIRILPHRTAPAESASWSWWVDAGGGRLACPPLLSGWDYSSELTIGVTVTLELGDILRATGLGSADDISVVAVVDCKSTQRRFLASAAVSVDGLSASAEAQVVIPAGSVAQRLQLSSAVVLASGNHPTAPRVARLKGARLVEGETVSLLLEGDSGRFPTEPVAFGERGLGSAPWTVMLTYEDAADSFMGSVRLLINTEHPVGRAVLDPSSAGRYAGLMRADLLRGLVARLGQDVVAGMDYEDESVAGVVAQMCEGMLGCSLRDAISLLSSDPISFELQLQGRLDPYRELMVK